MLPLFRVGESSEFLSFEDGVTVRVFRTDEGTRAPPCKCLHDIYRGTKVLTRGHGIRQRLFYRCSKTVMITHFCG